MNDTPTAPDLAVDPATATPAEGGYAPLPEVGGGPLAASGAAPSTVDEAEGGAVHRDLCAAFEALLFATREPLPRARLLEIAVAHGYDRDLAAEALAAVVAAYDGDGHGIQVVEVAGGYQLATKPAQAVWVADLTPPRKIRLSQQALETLSLIAYKQPIIRAEIEQVRGVNPMGTLKTLMEHDLIRVAGRREIPGKPLMYATTKNFLKVFGLRRLADLPTVAEFAEARTTQEELDLDLPEGMEEGVEVEREAVVETVTAVEAPETASMEGWADEGEGEGEGRD